MTITYPRTIPGSATDIGKITLTMQNMVGVSESPFTFEQQVTVGTGQRWVMSVTLNPMARADGEAWRAWLASLNGRYGTFVMGDPSGATPRGSAQRMIAASSGQTGSSIGFVSSASVGSFLLPGDYLQIGSADSTPRLHRVLETVTTSSNGYGVADIWPSIRTSPSSGDVIYHQNTVGIWRLMDGAVDEEITVPGIYHIAFSAQEKL